MAGVVNGRAALRRGGPINGEWVTFLLRHAVQGHTVFLPGLEQSHIAFSGFVDIDRILKRSDCVISYSSKPDSL